MIRRTLLNMMIAIALISCEPEEIPIDVSGIINYIQIDIGENYCHQKYYNIADDIVVGENLITDWDLAFHNTHNAIMLNSSKKMRAIVVDDPVSINDPTISFPNPFLEIGYDDPSGALDLLAFYNGQEALYKGFFLVDHGRDCNDDQLGYSIINIIDYDENSYSIKIIYLDNGPWDMNSKAVEIQKTNSDSHTYFSFTNNSIVSIADFEWDLCVSQYTEFNVPAPGSNNSAQTGVYLLRGILQNSHVSVAIDNSNSFSDLTIDLIDNYQFSFNRNSIGWDWKEYNNGQYIIDSPVYIVKTSENNYYKLLFIDYYNDNGEHCAPEFQIEKL